jgi:hypothetical protein
MKCVVEHDEMRLVFRRDFPSQGMIAKRQKMHLPKARWKVPRKESKKDDRYEREKIRL